MVSEKDDKFIQFISADIEKIGIDLYHGAAVIITLVPEKHAMLEEFTKENIGKEIIFRANHDILFKGVLREPIKRGVFLIECASENQALEIIKKLGIDKPDYYLKPTPADLKSAKHQKDVLNLPWAKEVTEAMSDLDYAKAEGFVQKAIAANPKEPYFYSLLSMIYYDKNKKNLALDQLLKAKALIKDEDICKNRGVYLDLANLYSEFKSYGKAIATYQILINSKCDLYSDHNKLAKLYENLGKVDLAMQEYILLSKADDKEIAKSGFQGIERLKKKEKK